MPVRPRQCKSLVRELLRVAYVFCVWHVPCCVLRVKSRCHHVWRLDMPQYTWQERLGDMERFDMPESMGLLAALAATFCESTSQSFGIVPTVPTCRVAGSISPGTYANTATENAEYPL